MNWTNEVPTHVDVANPTGGRNFQDDEIDLDGLPDYVPRNP